MNLNFNDLGTAANIAFAAAIVIAVTLVMVMQYLFLRTLNLTLQNCREENRKMRPGRVWLNMIPVVGVVGMFIAVQRVAASLRAEYDSYSCDYGERLGLFATICLLCGIVPLLGTWFLMAGLVLGGVYWLQLSRSHATSKAKMESCRSVHYRRAMRLAPQFA